MSISLYAQDQKCQGMNRQHKLSFEWRQSISFYLCSRWRQVRPCLHLHFLDKVCDVVSVHWWGQSLHHTPLECRLCSDQQDLLEELYVGPLWCTVFEGTHLPPLKSLMAGCFRHARTHTSSNIFGYIYPVKLLYLNNCILAVAEGIMLFGQPSYSCGLGKTYSKNFKVGLSITFRFL